MTSETNAHNALPESIQFLFFDLDRTLVDHDYAEEQALKEFCSEHDAPFQNRPNSELIKQWRNISVEYWERFAAGDLSYREQRRGRLKSFLNCDDSELSDEKADEIFHEYLEIYVKHIHLFPDVQTTLKNLRSRNKNVGIITNGNRNLQIRKLNRTDLDGTFSPVICSDDAERPKPSRDIFDLALQRANSIPEQTLYIGDDPDTDLKPVENLGWTPVWLNRAEHNHTPDPPDTDLPRRMPVIDSLTDLPDLISGR